MKQLASFRKADSPGTAGVVQRLIAAAEDRRESPQPLARQAGLTPHLGAE
jgi:hypothetical protein